MKRLAVALLLGALHPLTGADRAIALDIPIQVQEILPSDIPARARATEVVRVGVPLPLDEQIQSVDELGFSGSSAAQFRVLHRDPQTQSIRWVLARFLAAPGATGLALTRGSGDFGAPDLASDQDSLLAIDTGVATFEVSKLGFRFLDRVVRNGNDYVRNGGRGIVVKHGAKTYSSSLDPNAEVSIEENGPLEAVILARGHLTSDSGTRYLAYTARLHFYRGQASCRAFVTLRNGELASLSVKSFDAAWVELPVQLGGQRDLRFGTSTGDVHDVLDPGGSAYLLQGDNDCQRSGRTVRVAPYLTSAVGLEVDVQGSSHRTPGLDTDWSTGWMGMQDSTRAVFAGMRDLAPQFPGGFHVEDSLVCAELFSRHNPLKDLLFSWGAHETRELLFTFTDPGSDPQDFHYALQYPLIGRCSFEQYRDSGAIYGATQLVSVDEEQAFFAEQGQTWNLPEYTQQEITFIRQWSFRTTGGGNQFDKDLTYLLDWIRSGSTGHLARGRVGVVWKADGSVYHSDDFDYGDRENGISDVDIYQPDTFHGKGAGSLFDDEHPHWVSLPVYYWITGDERIREAIENYIEYRRYRGGHPYYGAVKGGGISHMRLWSRAFRDMALGYEIIQRQRYLDDLRVMTRALVDTFETNGSRGRNLERGYFYFGDEEDPDRRIHLFFLTEMNPNGVREAMRVLPAGDPLREELRDYLAGLAWFTLHEAQISPTAVGYPYGYYSAIPNYDAGNRGDQTGIVLTHGYRMSGDARFIERARSMTWRILIDSNELRASELATHLRIWGWNHRQEAGAVLITPTAMPNPDGSWTLSWLAPSNAREYIVKYGDRPLVESLDFDQLTRQYATDPDSAMNFWAATNLPSEPAPGPAHVMQHWKTPILPTGKWHFAVKALLNESSAWSPVSAPDLGQTQEDQPLELDVLSNDEDPDNGLDTSSVSIVAPPENGTATVSPLTGIVTYSPAADFYGTDRFWYQVLDEDGNASQGAEVVVEVTPVNDPPNAVDDFTAADPDESISILALLNDNDVDADHLRILRVDTSSLTGTLEISPDNTWLHYTAPREPVGLDQFQYVITDGNGGLDSASVNVEMITVAVELQDLQAQNVDQGIALSWHFESDEEVEGFAVFRSTNEGPLEALVLDPVAATNRLLHVLDPGAGLQPGDTLKYRLQALLATGERRLLAPQAEIVYAPPRPLEFSLEQSRPNPFNPRTAIAFTLTDRSYTSLRIYDVLGRRVRALVDEELLPGRYTFDWDGTDQQGRPVPSGTYFYRLRSGRFWQARSMRLIK